MRVWTKFSALPACIRSLSWKHSLYLFRPLAFILLPLKWSPQCLLFLCVLGEHFKDLLKPAPPVSILWNTFHKTLSTPLVFQALDWRCTVDLSLLLGSHQIESNYIPNTSFSQSWHTLLRLQFLSFRLISFSSLIFNLVGKMFTFTTFSSHHLLPIC